ncbi:MAG: iron donor protein CyaY [Deltaproteobacteria bacterium]|nr:iron donor protein CyaY [Deltaproteobacteria bacterium]
MDEKEYRRIVDGTFRRLEKAFDSVDPDVAEFELSQGSITILFSDRSKCILSTQPSVRQIWLAAASRGRAYHFDFDPASERWLDDKGKGVELLEYVRVLVKETAGVELSL